MIDIDHALRWKWLLFWLYDEARDFEPLDCWLEQKVRRRILFFSCRRSRGPSRT